MWSLAEIGFGLDWYSINNDSPKLDLVSDDTVIHFPLTIIGRHSISFWLMLVGQWNETTVINLPSADEQCAIYTDPRASFEYEWHRLISAAPIVFGMCSTETENLPQFDTTGRALSATCTLYVHKCTLLWWLFILVYSIPHASLSDTQFYTQAEHIPSQM